MSEPTRLPAPDGVAAAAQGRRIVEHPRVRIGRRWKTAVVGT
ncbi:hypothetical protein ACWGDT_22020 [Streptomyces avermitilis]